MDTKPEPARPHSRSKRRLAIMAALFLVVLLSGGSWVGIKISAPQPPSELITAQKQVTFPLYYSRKLPKGFGFDKKSLSQTKEVVLCGYTYAYGKKHLSFSMQPRPAGYDTSNLKNGFTTSIGRAHIIDLDDRTSAIIITDKSWVIINTPDNISVNDVRTFIDSLRPVTTD